MAMQRALALLIMMPLLAGCEVDRRGYFKSTYTTGKPFAIAAENAKSSGLWLYFHENGALFAAGEFAGGRCEGPWIMCSIEGVYVEGAFNPVLCDGSSLGVQIPGWSTLRWDLLAWPSAGSLLPGIAEGWMGSGYYRSGVRERGLTPEELKHLGAKIHSLWPEAVFAL
jgi:hypothetical protein